MRLEIQLEMTTETKTTAGVNKSENRPKLLNENFGITIIGHVINDEEAGITG